MYSKARQHLVIDLIPAYIHVLHPHSQSTDLLTKKWEPKDYIYQTSVETKAQDLVVNTTLSTPELSKQLQVSGKVKGTYKAKGFGELTAEVSNDTKAKVTGKFDSLYDGVVVNTEGNFCGEKCQKAGKLGVEYAAAPFTFTAEYACQDKAVVSASFAVDKLSIGGSVVATTQAITDKALGDVKVEAGVQYEDGAFTGTAITDRSGALTLSVYNNVKPSLQLATQVKLNKLETTNFVTGFQYVHSPATTIKGKIAISNSQTVASGFLEHRFNSTTVVGVSKEVDLTNEKSKLGVNLAFGQY